jgi:hypothetical protein
MGIKQITFWKMQLNVLKSETARITHKVEFLYCKERSVGGNLILPEKICNRKVVDNYQL